MYTSNLLKLEELYSYYYSDGNGRFANGRHAAYLVLIITLIPFYIIDFIASFYFGYLQQTK
jgi:hypothetical protein